MLLKDLLETPIADMEVKFHDDYKRKSFRDTDKKLLSSNKGIAKIYRAFEKTPFVFNIYVFMGGKKQEFPKKTQKKNWGAKSIQKAKSLSLIQIMSPIKIAICQ